MKTDKLKEKELQISSILEMRFGDGTGQDLQVKLATKEIKALLSSVRQETIDEVEKELYVLREGFVDGFYNHAYRNTDKEWVLDEAGMLKMDKSIS